MSEAGKISKALDQFCRDNDDLWDAWYNSVREKCGEPPIETKADLRATIAEQAKVIEGLREALAEAESEFYRIDCEKVTQTQNMAQALDRAKLYAMRGAKSARAAKEGK